MVQWCNMSHLLGLCVCLLSTICDRPSVSVIRKYRDLSSIIFRVGVLISWPHFDLCLLLLSSLLLLLLCVYAGYTLW